MKKMSYRKKTLLLVSIYTVFILYVFIKGSLMSEDVFAIDFANKLQAPSFKHIFGTDAYGRDMYLRTVKGLSLSIRIAFLATIGSLVVSMILALLLASGGKKMDTVITFVIDIFLSIPHMIFLIIISVAVGRGVKGVMIGIIATHWTYLTRILRAEIKELKEADFLKVASKLGKSNWYIAVHHILPNLVPQILVGTVLLFPHAILHESGISFLGFGLSLSTPAIGIILAESMQYLTIGAWWLAFFPGLMLVLVVLAILGIGGQVNRMVDPYRYHL